MDEQDQLISTFESQGLIQVVLQPVDFHTQLLRPFLTPVQSLCRDIYCIDLVAQPSKKQRVAAVDTAPGGTNVNGMMPCPTS